MLSIVIAGLVRSLQNSSVHYKQSYRQRIRGSTRMHYINLLLLTYLLTYYRHMTVKVYVCTNIKHRLTKVCVQNVLRMLECKLEDVDATA